VTLDDEVVLGLRLERLGDLVELRLRARQDRSAWLS